MTQPIQKLTPISPVSADSTHDKLTLHDMRKQSGISGADAARLCATTYRSLRNWETGETIPDIIYIQQLLSIYGYTFDQLDLSLFNEKHRQRLAKQKNAEHALYVKQKLLGSQTSAK